MASHNYKIGRSFEYRVLAYLRKLGYYCVRAYASKGLYDIVAIAPLKTHGLLSPGPLLIQAKSNGYIHPKELQELKDNDRYQAVSLIAFKGKNRELKFRSLNGEEVLIK